LRAVFTHGAAPGRSRGLERARFAGDPLEPLLYRVTGQ
jgi:hypothetical protein